MSTPISTSGMAPGQPLTSNLSHAELALANVDKTLHQSHSDFWHSGAVDFLRWNRKFPYQLIVLRKLGDGYAPTGQKFTLPIPPSELSISTPFAINVSATLGGIVEEHNGAPFKNISATGSFGVAPLKGLGGEPPTLSFGEAIYAGTISAANRLANTSSNIFDSSTQAIPNNIGGNELQATGYAQFRYMQMFLESYVQQKATGGGRDLRLAFAMWKDEAVYLVTPLDFALRRSASSPLEYTYALQMKAWKRIPLEAAYSTKPHIDLAVRNPNKMADILATLDAGQQTLRRSSDLLGAMFADTIEAGRKLVVFAKAAVGAGFTLADMPATIAKRARDAIIEGASVAGQARNSAKNTQKLYEDAGKNWGSLGPDALAAAGREAAKKTFEFTRSTKLNGSADPVEYAFDEPQKHADLSEGLSLGDQNLPPQVWKFVNDERQAAIDMSSGDIENNTDSLARAAEEVEAGIGVRNSTYEGMKGLAPSASKNREPTTREWELLFALNNMVQAGRALCVSNELGNPVRPTEYVAGLASQSGIAFKEPKSKISVPFPYGATLEKLAARYLGDPNRWMEIASLNGLREPYVDEEGFTVDVVAPGKGNQITIRSSENLYIGQAVWLVANEVAREKRHIENIEEIDATNVRLTLDGDHDLERFTPMAQAKLESFLPDTVNSQMLIFIPSDTEPDDEDFRTKAIPGVDMFDPLTRAGGVDLLLTEDNDLAITNDGDARLAIGLTNLVQRARVALNTERGSVLHHPDFGLGLKKGMSVADVNAQTLVEGVRQMFTNDPSFTGVEYAAVRINGPVAELNLSVGIAGTNRTLPLTFALKR